MSRIGKKPVAVPQGVTVSLDGQSVSAKGPKGELKFIVNELCSVSLENDEVVVTPLDKSKDARAQWGMNRTMISNIIEGVSKAYEKKLELHGVGYRAQMKGKDLNLQLGFAWFRS